LYASTRLFDAELGIICSLVNYPQYGGTEASSKLRSVALDIPRDDSSTAAEMLLNSNWFAATKNPGDCEFRLLKLIAGPVPTLIWKWRVPFGKM
jgi:hypothetical protein